MVTSTLVFGWMSVSFIEMRTTGEKIYIRRNSILDMLIYCEINRNRLNFPIKNSDIKLAIFWYSLGN